MMTDSEFGRSYKGDENRVLGWEMFFEFDLRRGMLVKALGEMRRRLFSFGFFFLPGEIGCLLDR